MRAAVRTEYGGPGAVGFEDVPDPVPAAGEIVVRVHATTVNRTDCAYRSGHPWINRLACGWPRPRVHVLGSEYAGEVVRVGQGVDAFTVGDRVFGFVDGRPGAHAELVAVPVDGLVAHVPEALAAHLAALMGRGAYRPVVDRTFAFDELREAYAYVDTGRKVGNVVVVMPVSTADGDPGP